MTIKMVDKASGSDEWDVFNKANAHPNRWKDTADGDRWFDFDDDEEGWRVVKALHAGGIATEVR